MAVAGWWLRDKPLRRSLPANKDKRGKKDAAASESSKELRERTFEILTNVCKERGEKNLKKVSYLNSLTKIVNLSKKKNYGFFMTKEHLLRCLKPCITSKDPNLKAAGFRVIRYAISSAEDVAVLNTLQIPNLIARSIDLGLKSDVERIQAFRLTLKILILNPKQFSPALTRSLVSFANSICDIKDRMSYSCLAILCHICVLNPELLIECFGQTALLRCTVDIPYARVNECLVGCLLFLSNKPDIRHRANVNLEYLISSYCECDRKSSEKEPHLEYRINALSVLATLRSWTGVYEICQPDNVSGIKAIVDVLHLHRSDLRRAILELLYQVFGLDHELWTDELSVAFKNIDPSKYKESWKINQRFVVAEGRDILPHKIFYRPNLVEIHTALIVYTFLECGLLSALVEVIISTDTFLSIQAVILLGFILHLSYKLLPSEIIDLGPSLPTLAGYIADGLPRQRCQALTAITTLCKIHEILKKKPRPNSLFLQQLLYYNKSSKNGELEEKSDPYKLAAVKSRKRIKAALKELELHLNHSRVLKIPDPLEWNWYHIEASLKSTCDSFVRMQEAHYKSYIRKLIHFFKPSSRKYSTITYNNKTRQRDIFTTTSFYLIDYLLLSDDGEKEIFLNDFLSDLSKELTKIVTSESVYQIFFNPQHMISTMSQHYFLMIGYLSCTHKGTRALNKCLILQTLLQIVGSCRHEYYAKLILSSLNYNSSGASRIILSKAINSPVVSVRVYATELLLILARIGVQNFSKWGIDLLITQMYDKNKTVAAASINILHELCYDSVYLESLLSSKPSLLHLGDRGNLLLIRFLSTNAGFILLSKANFIEPELLKWEKDFNYRYVNIVETDLHDSLTLIQNKKHLRRLTYGRHRSTDVFVHPHLYGELAKHERGFQALMYNGYILKMTQNLHKCCWNTELDIADLKASLWGLSNMSTSKLGFQFLDKENLFQVIVKLAQTCPVLSVRATAFYCVCLISTTTAGANALTKHGWYSVRHNRSEQWPILDQQLLLLDEPQQPDFTDEDSPWICDPETPYKYETETESESESEPEEEAVDSRKSKLKLNLNSSAKKFVTLPAGLLRKTKSSEKKNLSDGQCSEKEAKRSKSSDATSSGNSHPKDYFDTYFKKTRNSSEGRDSCEGSSEDTQKFRLQQEVGLARLRSLYISRRPVITGSASDTELRREFLYQMGVCPKPRPSSLRISHFISVPIRKKIPSRFILCYKGISFPKPLSQFFLNAPGTTQNRKDDRIYLRRDKKRRSLSFNEVEQVKKVDEDYVNFSMSSDSSDDEKKPRKPYKYPHNVENCIGCCTKSQDVFMGMLSGGSGKLRAESLCYGLSSTVHTSVPSLENVGAKRRVRISSEWLKGKDEVETGKEESKDEKMSAEDENEARRTRVKREILKHVARMINPVLVKATKQELFRLKRKYPSMFGDVCLYSIVCSILSTSTCRFSARRFIQELFSDVLYFMVYEDAISVLRQYLPVMAASTAAALLQVTPRPRPPPPRIAPKPRSRPNKFPQPKTIIANSTPIRFTDAFANVPVTEFTRPVVLPKRKSVQ